MTSTIVLLHGFTHTGASWEPVLSGLGERYMPIAPDIRGHGRAGDRVPVTLDAVMADVNRLTVDSYALVGYSMGGRIALHIALADPGRVDRLVLIGASPGLADPREREERCRADERLVEEIESLRIEEFAERWAANPVLAGQPARLREAVRADRLRNSPEGLGRALRGLGTGTLPSVWHRLPELKLPVTLVVGERDGRFRVVAEEMSRAMLSAKLVVVPGAGHAVHLEAPDAVAEIIDRS